MNRQKRNRRASAKKKQANTNYKRRRVQGSNMAINERKNRFNNILVGQGGTKYSD